MTDNLWQDRTAVSAFCLPPSALAAYSRRIEYCCPVSHPHCPSRARLLTFAPATLHAARSSSVSDWLHRLEAPPKRARQKTCLGVRGSFGLIYRCRHCLLPRIYHTQSPHRPLLSAGSRHAPEDARKGHPRHPRLTGTARFPIAFRPWESVGVRAFIFRHATLVSPAALGSQASRLTSLLSYNFPRMATTL